MATAAKTIAGVDIWLNTSLSTQEASGTSGIEAALCGWQILDGWWIEGVTG